MTGSHADASTYLATGTVEEARGWLGREVVREAAFAVNESQIANFCALVEDPDENHWDPEAARQRYGALVSPPGMLMVWAFPPPWQPGGRPEHGPLLALEVPLPGSTLINVSTDSSFHRPMLVGDRLVYSERLTALSEEKTTVLGTGHFLTTLTECRSADGTLVATNENVLFRYQPAAEDGVAPEPSRRPPEQAPARAPEPTPERAPAEQADGAVERLPSVSMPVTVSRCVLDAAATRDFFRGHHDRDYARSQGARDAYLNTMFFHGLVDRVGKGWAGPDAWLRRRTLRMLTPVCVGDTLRTEGQVTALGERDGRRVAELDVDVHTEHGVGVRSRLTFDLDGLR